MQLGALFGLGDYSPTTAPTMMTQDMFGFSNGSLLGLAQFNAAATMAADLPIVPPPVRYRSMLTNHINTCLDYSQCRFITSTTG